MFAERKSGGRAGTPPPYMPPAISTYMHFVLKRTIKYEKFWLCDFKYYCKNKRHILRSYKIVNPNILMRSNDSAFNLMVLKSWNKINKNIVK